MSTWKKVNNADPGDSSRFGGNDIDEFYGMLNGENTSSKEFKLMRWHKLGNSQTRFLDTTGNHYFVLNISMQTGDKQILVPDLGASNRTWAFTDLAQTWSLQTINVDQNTIRDSTTNIAGDILKGNGTKLIRMQKGSALQYLRVKSDGSDIEWGSLAGAWDPNGTETISGKTINASNNTITDTSIATGDILAGVSGKFVRKGRGTSLQALRTNSAGTDIEWASLQSERTGKHTASGNAATTVFTITHGLGSTPGYTFISVENSGTGVIAAKASSDSTTITVTFASPPSSGTNNVVINWKVVA